MADALLEINCTQGDPWEIVGQKFNTTKKKGSDIGESDSATSVGSVGFI